MGLDKEAQEAKNLPAGDAIEDAVDRLAFSDMFGGDVRRDAHGHRLNRRYSRDIRAALRVLTVWFAPYTVDYYSLTRTPTHSVPSMSWHKDAHWNCVIEGTTWKGLAAQRDAAGDGETPVIRQASPGETGYYYCEGEGETAPLAICRAMLHLSEE